MAIKAKIDFPRLPYELQVRLCAERGFHILYRKGGGAVLQKGWEDKITTESPPAPWNDDDVEWSDGMPYGQGTYHFEPRNPWEIPKWRQDMLERKCDHIVEGFYDPYNQMPEIRSKLKQMCNREGLTPVEYEWVENWTYTNVM